MKRTLLMVLLSTALVACGSDSSGGTPIITSSLQNAERADLSGQASVFVGTLGSGATFTFPAVKDQRYQISLQTTDSDDQVVLDFAGDDGAGLKSKTIDSGTCPVNGQPKAVARVPLTLRVPRLAQISWNCAIDSSHVIRRLAML